jgi:hypothetical protein
VHRRPGPTPGAAFLGQHGQDPLLRTQPVHLVLPE